MYGEVHKYESCNLAFGIGKEIVGRAAIYFISQQNVRNKRYPDLELHTMLHIRYAAGGAMR